MTNQELTAEQALNFAADLNIRVLDDSYAAELERYSLNVRAANNHLLADFTATVKVFSTTSDDESVLLEIDAKGLNLIRILSSYEIVSLTDFAEITEFQTRNSDRIEKLQEVCDEQLLIELQLRVE